MEELKSCPHCGSNNIIKAGIMPSGLQRYKCKSCGKKISAVTKDKYYRQTEVKCPHCNSFHTRLGSKLRDGSQRYVCCDCKKSFSNKTVIREKLEGKCILCGSSNLVRDGINGSGERKFLCKDCKISFTKSNSKEDLVKRVIQRDYRKGFLVNSLALKYRKKEEEILEIVERCDYIKHLKNLPNKLKKDIIFFGLGAQVSTEDLAHYFKIEERVVKKLLTLYKNKKSATI